MNPNGEPRAGIPQDKSNQPHISDVPVGINIGESPLEQLPEVVPTPAPPKPADNSPARYGYSNDYPLTGETGVHNESLT